MQLQTSAIVRENVLFGPAGDIEQRPRGEEVEASLGERHPVLSLEPLVEYLFQGVEVADIARRIVALGVAELVGAPVAGLLLLGHVDVEQLLDQILEAVPVGVGAYQPRRRARAIDRRWQDPEIGLDDADIEPREMVELEAAGVAEQRLQIGRRIVASALEADEVLVALAIRQ